VLAPIIYERRVGNYHLPEGSIVFGCTNLGVEGLGDTLQAHLRNRLIVVRMRKPTATEWLKWAEDAGIDPVVMAFVHQNDRVMHSFLDYEPGGSFHKGGIDLSKENPYIFNPRSEQDGYASPRSLHAASDIVKCKTELDDATMFAALCGALGSSCAGTLNAFVKFEQDITDYALVIADPGGAPDTKNPTAQVIQRRKPSFTDMSRIST
jgi:hypothetical protein